MMLGQVFNNITYNRRLSVLNALMKEDKSCKQVLKEKASIFSESHKELFGQNFREDWCTNLKTKQKYQEILLKETKSTPTTFSKNRPPFRGGPPASSYGRGGGGRAPQAFFVRTMPQTQRQHGKSNKITLPQHSTTSGCRQVKSSSFGQKPFPYQRETSSSGRKTKILFRKLGKINSRCEYFVHCAGFQNSFLPNPISVWSSPISKGEPRGKVTNKFRNKGNVEERCNSTGEIRTWGISEQFVLSKQEGWRSSTCNKYQISEQLNTLPTFQNGRDAFHKGSSPRARLFDKDRSKRCLFWHTSRRKLKKIYSFTMGRKFIRILLLMFWPGSSPLILTKLLKIPIALLRRINVRVIIFLEDMLVTAQTLKQILQAKETLIFLLQNLAFKKSQLTPVKE